MDYRTALDRTWARWTRWLEAVCFAAMVLAVALLGFAALAQNTEVLTPAPLEIDPHNTALQILDAIKNGQWWLVASLAVSLLTWGVRAGLIGKLLGKVAPAAATWLTTHPAVGYAIPFVLSAIGGVATTFASGMPFTWGSLLGEILKVGLGAVGLFIGKKTIEESRSAGALERAKVATVADANRELLKP